MAKRRPNNKYGYQPDTRHFPGWAGGAAFGDALVRTLELYGASTDFHSPTRPITGAVITVTQSGGLTGSEWLAGTWSVEPPDWSTGFMVDPLSSGTIRGAVRFEGADLLNAVAINPDGTLANPQNQLVNRARIVGQIFGVNLWTNRGGALTHTNCSGGIVLQTGHDDDLYFGTLRITGIELTG